MPKTPKPDCIPVTTPIKGKVVVDQGSALYSPLRSLDYSSYIDYFGL